MTNQPTAPIKTGDTTAWPANRPAPTWQPRPSPTPSPSPTRIAHGAGQVTQAQTGRVSTIAGNAPTPGEEKTTSAIVRYVNCFAEENYGILIDTDPGGMILVYWDEFTPLLLRLGNRISDFDRRNLGVHKGWVRAPQAGPNGSYTELLPIDTPVDWSCGELWRAQQESQSGIVSPP